MSRGSGPPIVKRPGGFVAVHREWFDSEAYRDLSLVARCLLAEIHNLNQPNRNGHISLSVANAAERLRVTQKTVRPAFHELAEHGFIALTKGDYWQKRLAREWCLTFERRNNHEPTDDWRRWREGEPVVKLPKRNPTNKKTRG